MTTAVVIEFAGLPGAGKTTVAKELVAYLEKRNIACTRGDLALRSSLLNPYGDSQSPSVFSRIAKRIHAVARCPSFAHMAYSLALQLRPWRVKNVARADTLVRELEYVRRISLLPREVQIYDELLIHRIFSMIFGGTSSEIRPALTRLFKDAYRELPHVLILLDIDPEICIERYSMRPSPLSRFNAATDSQMKRKFRNDFSYKLIRRACEDAGLNCWTFSADSSPALLAKEIGERLLEAEGLT